MLKQLIMNKLETLNFSVKDTGNPYIITNCLNPTHNDKHPSFSINCETGFGKCFSCGFIVKKDFWLDGELDDEMIEQIETASLYVEAHNMINSSSPVLTNFPEELLPPYAKAVPDGWRGFTAETLTKNNMYLCEKGFYSDRVIMPIFNKDNEIAGFNTRTTIDAEPKYLYNKNLDVKNLAYPLLDNKTDYVIVTEGMLDALSLQQLGYPVITNFGVADNFGKLKIQYLLSKGVETILLAFDQDEAGEKGMEALLKNNITEIFEVKLLKYSMPELAPFYLSDCKDFNDYLQIKKPS